jgi:hypothetical protein
MLVLPDAEDAERVADWVELELSLGEVSFSKSKVASIVRDVEGTEPSETFGSDVWRYLRRRASLYSSDFFEIHGDLAVRRADVVQGRLEYQVCLFFSLYGAAEEQRSDPKLFERMSAEAINQYVGGETFVFGWPVLPDVQIEIGNRVKQVSELLQERFVEAPPTRYRDRGVDIISWRPFAEPEFNDRRSGQWVLLSQCAAGYNWPQKTRELPIGAWVQYIHWATDPTVGFVVPCVIDDRLWHEITREVRGLVFDRVRVVNHLTNGVQDNNLRTELEAWVAEQIDEHKT